MPNQDTPDTTVKTPAKKGAPTPSRAEREAARKKPLVPTDRKAAARQSRAQLAEERAKARMGLAAGDERYLTARDRGPQRRFVRDVVDARLNIGELMLPVLFLIILLSFFNNRDIDVVSYIALWAYIALVIVDSLVLGFTLKRRIERKFGPGSMQRGTRWYASMRAIQFRSIRLPKPAVKRFSQVD
ncbi:MAG TPA: DUF3043 domain-containing protein [Microbacteriaceae bacterium]|nr:DUF3043 domain-containing protein [Microbacteriaceae bacterium]